MKKKLIILAGVVLIGAFLGKTMISNASEDQTISKEWTIEEKNIEGVEVLGCAQKVNVVIQQTEEEATVVKVTGAVSERVANDLEDAKFDGKKLSLALGSTSAIGVTIKSKKMDVKELNVTVSLGKDASVSKYFIEGTAPVDAKIPETFEGEFQLETNDKGKVLAVPETKKTEKTVFSVDTVGDISITK